jgi:hypothetical protein
MSSPASYLRVMAIRNTVGRIDEAAVALAVGSKVPAVKVACLDAGEGRVAAETA